MTIHLEQYVKNFKKPKSQVPGDIPPDLVTKFCDQLAVPLTFIYNQVLNTLEWPALWKAETVTVIPKNNSPSELSELRNLSCTPLFSKVLEAFILERMKKEVKLSNCQYGGIKGCSTEHFLLKTWDQILTALDDGTSATSLVSIDFAKAFNRMDHARCLEALSHLGASVDVVRWTSAFLYRRTMSVRVRNARSIPRLVPGGSPQGSILGNFLFCATTDCFARLESPYIELNQSWTESSSDSSSDNFTINTRSPGAVSSTPTARGQFATFKPPTCLADLSGEFVSDEEDDFRFIRRLPNPLDSFDESDQQYSNRIKIPNCACPDPLTSLVYIDDYNTIVRLSLKGAQQHITTRRRELRLLAAKSELQFAAVQRLAANIGMQVNEKKTQLLCIAGDSSSDVSSYIRTDTGEISSGKALKILGFHFDSKPSAVYHVTQVINSLASIANYGRLGSSGGLE